jgi:hypothetical protein
MTLQKITGFYTEWFRCPGNTCPPSFFTLFNGAIINPYGLIQNLLTPGTQTDRQKVHFFYVLMTLHKIIEFYTECKTLALGYEPCRIFGIYSNMFTLRMDT